MDKIESLYSEFLENRGKQSLKRGLVDVIHPNAREISQNGRDYINFSSNDYLGLSQHPALIERAQEWAAEYGAGSSASRLVTGNLDIFTKLEDKIAAFKDKEAALIMVSGFQANTSVLPALFDKKVLGTEPLVFSDKLNHASMHLGCDAAGVQQIRFKHNDMTHLKSLLDKHDDSDAPKFILCESVYSMDGDIAPLKEIYKLARTHNCFTIVDEAHATGILGEQGQGLATGADLVIGTFSKAFGSFGAYVACTKTLKEYLVNKCSGLIYTTALPPATLGSIDAALGLIPSMDKEREHLRNLSTRFRNEMLEIGFDCGGSQSQIVPVIIGDANNTLELSQTLKENGLWATAIRPPTVPPNSARLRFAFSAAHTNDDLDKLIGVLKNSKLKQAA